MRVVQVIKKLNNTELGKSGTHEFYVQVPQNLEISDLFPETDTIQNFIYKKNGKIYHIRCTIGREKRIVGLGDFYRDNDVCAGDEVVLERHISEDESTYFIDLNKRKDILMLQRCRKGFELLNAERKNLITHDVTVYSNGKWGDIRLEFLGSEKKRDDSPTATDIYDLRVDGISVVNNFSGKEMVEVQVDTNNEKAYVNRICAWKRFLFEMEEQDD